MLTVAELIKILESFKDPEYTNVSVGGKEIDFKDVYLCPECGRVEIGHSERS